MVWAFYAAGECNARRDRAQNLVVAALGANGTGNALEQQMSEWADA